MRNSEVQWEKQRLKVQKLYKNGSVNAHEVRTWESCTRDKRKDKAHHFANSMLYDMRIKSPSFSMIWEVILWHGVWNTC